jgi:hypothetical protein
MQVLRDIVVNSRDLDDKRLLMMFCGVDSLEDINNIAETEK